eukprot:2724634-Rhodomonas_salina.4
MPTERGVCEMGRGRQAPGGGGSGLTMLSCSGRQDSSAERSKEWFRDAPAHGASGVRAKIAGTPPSSVALFPPPCPPLPPLPPLPHPP